jgi:LacI family transcriptional regulator
MIKRDETKAPRLTDIAKRAGVSVAAVSIALSGEETSRVSPAVRAKIRAIADELKYRPHVLAKALAEQRSRIIGIMVPLRDPIFFNYFIAQLLSGVQSVLIERGYNLLVYTPSGDPGRMTAEKAFRSSLVDGLIYVNTRSCSAKDVNKTIAELTEVNLRFAMVNSYYGHADIDYVGADDEALGEAAARYLVQSGHRRIALLGGIASLPAHVKLVKGLRRGLQEANVSLPEEMIGCSMYEAAKAFSILDQWLLSRKSGPLVVIAADESLLSILYDYVDAKGLKVPDDIAILGRISAGNANMYYPRPTAFLVPTFDMGRRVAEMLIDSIEDKHHEKARAYLPFTFAEGRTM